MALLLFALCGAGFGAGWILLRKVPTAAPLPESFQPPQVSIIIPARNEASTLPRLLDSIAASSARPWEIIVVDDQSTDATAMIAAKAGARVVSAPALEAGWTGKSWACHHGALFAAAAAPLLFFLDADTYFVKDGYARIVREFSALPKGAALSVLPYHRMKSWSEQLSLFFNVITAMAAGGFTGAASPLLFGQSLLISKELYFAAGGHASIRGEILENLHLSSCIKSAGGQCHTLGGRTALEMRMFPHGARQQNESWRKGFAAGASAVRPLVRALSATWLGGLALSSLLLVLSGAHWTSWIIYALLVAQLSILARQVGNFNWMTLACFPVSLAYYMLIFTQSAWRRATGKAVTWRGRSL
ncbi:glycosyltransferase [Silvibacterium sp.]|uniref:glycosyltransferase n=1 Tax=Silvibacterium sp. TaxID=1964179 RepID=UPI0039E354A3